MIGYKPNGMNMWDAWCIQRGNEIHVFHLQTLAVDSSRTENEASSIGHAITTDMAHWTEMPVVIPPNAPGTLDDLRAFTGCIYEYENKYYMYYTMRSNLDEGKVQYIGLATSDDLYSWTRYPGNPLFGPDPQYYVHKGAPLPNGIVDCRDFVVVDSPDGNGWYGFYAVRTPATTMCSGTAIAVSRSDDLINWAALPPALKTNGIGLIEVPDVFLMNGKWYMTYLVDGLWANRNFLDHPGNTGGTIYAVSECIEGPYELQDDYILMTAPGTVADYSLRSFIYNSERLAVCVERISQTLSPFMRYFTTPEGYLRIGYSDLTQAYREKTLIEPTRAVELAEYPLSFIFQMPGGEWKLHNDQYLGWADGWQSGLFDVACGDVEMEAFIKIDKGSSAGLVYGEWTFLIDAERHEVVAGRLPTFQEVVYRSWPIELKTQYHMRVRIRKPRFEIYIDDALVVQFASQVPENPLKVGLVVDRAECIVHSVGVYSL